jgi:hypothetical protein
MKALTGTDLLNEGESKQLYGF